MDPGVMPSEGVPVLVVLSSLVTLCVLVITTVWMCWRMRGAIGQSEESNEFILLENTPPTDTPLTQQTEPLQDDPPDEENGVNGENGENEVDGENNEDKEEESEEQNNDDS